MAWQLFTGNYFSSDLIFEGYGIHLMAPAKRAEEISAFVERSQDRFDIVLAAPLSDAFGLLSSAKIAETFPRATVLSIPNFFFAGLQPDLTYLGGLGQRVQGPLGDYHSKIAIAAYALEIPLSGLADRFTADTFRRMKYFDAYDASLDEMRKRERGTLDIGFADELEVLLKRDLCFFSVNHPTSYLLGHFAAKASDMMSARGLLRRIAWPASSCALPNLLAGSAIFPVYPEIAEAHGLPFAGSYFFKPPAAAAQENVMELTEFLEGEYCFFERIGRENLLRLAQVKSAAEQLEAAR